VFEVFKLIRLVTGQYLHVRKRQRTGALQDVNATDGSVGASVRFWIAMVLHRFSARIPVAKPLGMARAMFVSLLALSCAFTVSAQSNAPPVSIFRSVVNDIPNEPLVTVTLTGASNVSCLTVEEDLPSPASPVSVSGDGVWLPALGVIRWGPYFNTAATNVSYRLSGLTGSYPIHGGAWMEGEWYFSPGTTIAAVLGGGVPAPPQQLPEPIFIPLSGSATPVDVLIGLPGWDLTLLSDTWAGGTRTTQNLPQQSAWFASGIGINITSNTNALNLWNGTNAVVGLTYFSPNATTPVTLGVGDTLRATLNLVLTGVAAANTTEGLRIGLFDFADSTLSPTEVATDGFNADTQGNGVRGYCLFQNMGNNLLTSTPVDIKLRTNIVDSTLQGNTADFSSLSGLLVSNNFPGFTNGRAYVLTLTLNRTGMNSLAFSASWLDTVSGGTFSNTGTNTAETNFRFDGLAVRSQAAASSATNITLNEFRLDYFPQTTNAPAGTTNTAIYYTLDGSTPTTNSLLYSNAIYLTTTSVVRSEAFATGWIPSVAAIAYYGFPPAATANAQVTRTVNTSSTTAPVVTFSVTPGAGASCIAVTESLPPGLAATSVTAGGNYIASNNVVLWGPFFGTNAHTLSYVAVGQPGTYPVQASWSVDGVEGGESVQTNIVVTGSGVPSAPPQVATPTFSPVSGGNVPVNVAISCATPGAAIYYTLDGSAPMETSTLYSNAVNLASAGTIRAVAFTNGWTPSAAAVAYYGPPAATSNAQVTRTVNTSSPTAPVVTFSVTPGAGATCVGMTESLPPGLAATGVTAGGNYIASNNVVLWGPFFGTNALVLSYVTVGQPGIYPVQASWSVDGVGGGESGETSIIVASASGGIPTPPLQEPVPTLTPSFGSSLPINVSISSSDSQAHIYYTTDGTLPTQSSTPYTSQLTISVPTTLRAVGYRAGYLASVSAVGYYAAAPLTNSVSLVRSILNNGTVLPSITISATPLGNLSCYGITETILPGMTPSGLATNAVWNPANSTIYWGPFVDNQPRALNYNLSGPTGTFPLAGSGSFDGYLATDTGATTVSFNPAYIGPATNYDSCVTGPISYSVDINPAPGLIAVDTATGTVDWGDGTQSNVTQPVMTIPKLYAASGTYTITLSVSWTGHTPTTNAVGNGIKTDTVEVYSSCDPVITNQPSNQVVVAGTTAQFTVGASSVFPLTYQWFLNESNSISSPTAIAPLILSNVTVQEGGLYSVVVANTYGSVTSSAAVLTVVTPVFTNITRNTNRDVTLGVLTLPYSTNLVWAATNLTPPVEWQAISTNIANSNGTWQFTDTNAVNFPERYYQFSIP